MRFKTLIVVLVLALAVPAAALAQFYNRPALAPLTVIGNPNAVNAPAQAIPFAAITTAIGASNLLNPTLPPTVDLNNLPPQTIVGNGTSLSAALGFITFAQLKALQPTASTLPRTTYNTYDPTNVPTLTAIGNASFAVALALPIPLYDIFFPPTPPVAGCSSNLVLDYSCTITLMARMTGN